MAARRRLTAATVGPALVAAGFAALASLTGNSWFVLVAGASAGLVLLSMAVRPRMGDLVMRVDGTTRLAVGDRVEHRLRVHNRGKVTSPPVMVTVMTDGLSDVRAYVGRIPPGGLGVAELVRTGTARRASRTNRFVLEATSPLGLLTTEVGRFDGRGLLVHPQAVPPDPAIALRGRGAETVDPVPGHGLDVAGIRDWRSGDEQRLVHWRSTARRGRLVVVERGIGPTPVLSVVVVGPSVAPDWEPVLATAAATTRAAQVAGGGVAVASWDRAGPSAPVTGTPCDLLDWWARVDEVALPSPADLVSARGGHPTAAALVVVASSHVLPSWWEQVHREAATAGLVVTGLTRAVETP
jgi:hypothetical protein